MNEAIPTCGWAVQVGGALAPCGKTAVAVNQVWATRVEEFMTDGALEAMVLLVCRDHEPREPLNVH